VTQGEAHNIGNRCATLQFSNYSKKQDKNQPLLKRFKGGLFLVRRFFALFAVA